ncbi:MAG TPA: LysM peptidoglycan-binding domain-containing protein [Burkholderiales bacterium]|nr:LysM peptidoglycan-binding domain-containing protein [Burkholderiales bacterium]
MSAQYPASSPTSYVVTQGDLVNAVATLKSIAFAVYGDSKLWYLIADANGLNADGSNLWVGQTLTIPNTITNVHNDYATHEVYNAGEIIGDRTPTLPDPPPLAASHRKWLAKLSASWTTSPGAP